MLNKIDYKIDFSNGNSLANAQKFTEGSFLVTGKNGQGKSLLLEMFAFCLFGSTALRGVATDYKKITADCQTTIRGVAYEITRTKSSATVYKAGVSIVTGTKPVNAWMVRTLGFNYSVFRIGHWCAQGDIQALASMKPTERKDMINSVTGLTQMEIMVESVVHRGRVAKAEIEVLEGSLRVLNAPAKPPKALTPAKKELTRLKDLQDEVSELSRAQRPEAPTEPVKPVEVVTAVKGSHRVYEEVDVAEVEVPEQFVGNSLEGLKAIRVDMAEHLVVKDTLQRVIDSLSGFAVKTFEETDLHRVSEEELSTLWDEWDLRRELERLKASKVVDCPECEHSFHLEHSEIAELEARNLPTEEPALNLHSWGQENLFLAKHEKYLTAVAEFELQDFPSQEDHDTLVEYLKAVASHTEELKRQVEAKQSVKDYNDKQERLYKLALDKDQQNHHAQSTGYKSRMERYSLKLADYELLKAEHDKKQAKLDAIALEYQGQSNLGRAIRVEAQEYQEVVSQWAAYDQLNDQYLKAVASNDAQKLKIAEKEQQHAEYNKAKKALAEVKLRVQSYVVPSLNKVASYLVAEMTGGRHQKIELTPEFELMVDGDPLRTLSGSGKDIANIALRIALGRILTHSVLPVMMLDEVDSAMDDERANYTWACIQKITPQIGQVIQASHKELVADNRVEV